MPQQKSIGLAHLLVPKSRKVDFEVNVLIHDLTNVPLISGIYFIKWRLRNSTNEKGSTQKAPLRDHTVQWEHHLQSIAEVIIGKDGVLLPCNLRLEIIQELHGGRDMEIIGNLVLNLSEYVGPGKTTGKYLLQNSKVNSILKLSIILKQKNEDVEFTVPPMKKQQIIADVSSMIVERDNIATRLQFSSDTPNPDTTLLRSPSSLSLALLSAETQTHPVTTIRNSGSSKLGVRASDFIYGSTGEISPAELVEQIFMGKKIEEIISLNETTVSDAKYRENQEKIS